MVVLAARNARSAVPRERDAGGRFEQQSDAPRCSRRGATKSGCLVNFVRTACEGALRAFGAEGWHYYFQSRGPNREGGQPIRRAAVADLTSQSSPVKAFNPSVLSGPPCSPSSSKRRRCSSIWTTNTCATPAAARQRRGRRSSGSSLAERRWNGPCVGHDTRHHTYARVDPQTTIICWLSSYLTHSHTFCSPPHR